MHRQHRRDRHHDLDRRQDDHLQQVHRRQEFYTDLNLLHQLMAHQYVVENYLLKVDAVKMVALQNLDAQNQDVVLTFLNAVHQVHQLDVVVDVELHHQLKMDCYQDVVDAELRHQLKMDCYQVVVLLALLPHQ
jgi:hypothetical protein